jgi:hypothetical protein
MGTRQRSERLRNLLPGLARDIRMGGLLSEQPHNVDFCICCEGDARVRRCDGLRRRSETRR